MAFDVSRFTDENYLTRNGMISALHTSLIDTFWSKTIEYRKAHAKAVSLVSVGKKRFALTLTPSILGKIEEGERRLSLYEERFGELSGTGCFPPSRERELLFPLLQQDASFEKASIPELTLKAMVNGFYAGKEESERPVLAYLSLLKKLQGADSASFEDALGEDYFALMGREDLACFYRDSDFRSVYTTSVVARDYDYAPFREIPSMMETLDPFCKDESVPVLARAFGALYYLCYVKPFFQHNEVLGELCCKRIFSLSLCRRYAYLLPILSFLDGGSAYRDILLQTQKDCDLTYFVLHCCRKLSSCLDALLQKASSWQKEAVADEFASVEGEPPSAIEPPAPAPSMQEEAWNEEEEEEKKEEEPSFEAVQERVQEKERGRRKPSAPLLSKEEEEAFLKSRGKTALLPPKGSYSEKEVKETARYLLETNPTLSKKQASFYASHCTIGRFYTIQDFKKATRCAYETARTSMDRLSEEGFYAKKQIKNKFVYTPLKQGEEK